VPAAALALYLLAPRPLQQRERSIFDVQADSSIRARIVMLHTGLAMIAAHPVFGVGPERVGPRFMDYKPPTLELPPGWYGHLHNDYLQIAAERGIPCLVIFLWLFIEVIREGYLLGRNPDLATRSMGHAEVAVTVGLMIAGLFEFNFGDSEVLMLYLFLIAAAVAFSRLPTSRLPTTRLPAEGTA
jgi:O-antigen ligase